MRPGVAIASVLASMLAVGAAAPTDEGAKTSPARRMEEAGFSALAPEAARLLTRAADLDRTLRRPAACFPTETGPQADDATPLPAELGSGLVELARMLRNALAALPERAVAAQALGRLKRQTRSALQAAEEFQRLYERATDHTCGALRANYSSKHQAMIGIHIGLALDAAVEVGQGERTQSR